MQILPEGEIPIIAAARYNQGIADYYDVPAEYENAITISCNGVGCGSTFYHDYPFAITGDAIVLKNIGNVPQVALPYLATILDAHFIRKYSYEDKCSADKAEAELVKLPATTDGEPDWAYMEEYMKQIMKKSENSIENLEKADDKKHLIDVNDWGKFKIDDIFNVVKGTRLTKANMKEGIIKFVGASAMNNGETHRIANDDHLHSANTITVCYNGSVGETFYQDEKFWASDDVNVLYPRFNMTKYMAFFVCPIIKSVGQKYAFIDKWKQEDMKNETIKLPITSTGEPDWQYMENYMRDIMTKSENAINNLTRCDS